MMALETCKTCGGPVSTNAKTCPHCGEKLPPRWTPGKRLVGIAFTVMVLGTVWNLAANPDQGAASPTPAAFNANRPEGKGLRAAASTLRAWNSTHKNPDSAQVNAVIVMSSGAGCINVRARNSFNAIVPAQIVVSPDGTPVSSEGDADDFRTAWDRWCAGNTGVDLTDQAKSWAGI